MRNQTCYMHNFDRETHRCKRCGRWEAGFAPKRQSTKPRAECQICEHEMALDAAGNLGHHGYKRPGVGFIVGDCPGVGHKPYPATDALESYRAALMGMLAATIERINDLREDRVAFMPGSYTITLREVDQYGRKHDTKHVVHYSTPRGAATSYSGYDSLRLGVPCTWSSFADMVKWELARQDQHQADLEREIKRVSDRIARAATLV